MRKGSSIVGLKVISQHVNEDEMANLGTVKDLVFDHESDELLALVISEKDLFGLIDAQVVPWDEIVTIGADAIIVQSVNSKIAAHDHPRVKEVMDRETVLSGTKIYTTDGRDLGTFADLYIDDETGRTVGYEISGGFVSDTMSGKRFIPAPQEITIGKDVALVPPSVADDIEAQKQQEPGGLQGAASSLGEKVGGAYETVKSSATETYANVANASVEKQKEFVVGKIASRDVFLPVDNASATIPADKAMVPADDFGADDTASLGTGGSTSGTAVSGASSSAPNLSISTASESFETDGATAGGATVTPISAPVGETTGSEANGPILVRQGETITQEHADQAEATGVLRQLVMAAGGGVAGGALSSGSSAAGGVGASVQQKAEDAALGKPAGRDVMAPDGSVIVAPGMIITREILEQARTYGKEKEVIASAGVGAAAQGVDAVKEGAGNLWDTIKHKAAELTGAAHEKKADMDAQAEESKIKNALGRPTTRVILDKSDHVILNAGDLITHAAIEQARNADALDILLDSVYVADPEITPEMLRAKEHGQAAIESEADAQPATSSTPVTGTAS